MHPSQENRTLKANMGYQEKRVIQTLQAENESLSRTIVESNRQQKSSDAKVMNLEEGHTVLQGQKADLEVRI